MCPEGLGRHREAVDIQPEEVLRELAVELLAAALIEPRQHGIGVTAEDRAGTEQRGALMLAVPVDGHGVGSVEHAVVDPVKHLEGLDHGTGGQQIDLQPAARHALYAIDVLAGEAHPDVPGGPGGLHPDDDRALRVDRAGAPKMPAAAAPPAAARLPCRNFRREFGFVSGPPRPGRMARPVLGRGPPGALRSRRFAPGESVERGLLIGPLRHTRTQKNRH